MGSSHFPCRDHSLPTWASSQAKSSQGGDMGCMANLMACVLWEAWAWLFCQDTIPGGLGPAALLGHTLVT